MNQILNSFSASPNPRSEMELETNSKMRNINIWRQAPYHHVHEV